MFTNNGYARLLPQASSQAKAAYLSSAHQKQKNRQQLVSRVLGPLPPKALCLVALRSRPPFTGVLLGPGPESAPRSAFWAILGTCLGVPQRVLFECFLAFLGPKHAKKHSQSTLWGTPRQVPKIAQTLRGALSGPGPKSTPANGGRDRNSCPETIFCHYILIIAKVACVHPSQKLSQN